LPTTRLTNRYIRGLTQELKTSPAFLALVKPFSEIEKLERLSSEPAEMPYSFYGGRYEETKYDPNANRTTFLQKR
jgi:hypothetical protein